MGWMDGYGIGWDGSGKGLRDWTGTGSGTGLDWDIHPSPDIKKN